MIKECAYLNYLQERRHVGINLYLKNISVFLYDTERKNEHQTVEFGEDRRVNWWPSRGYGYRLRGGRKRGAFSMTVGPFLSSLYLPFLVLLLRPVGYKADPTASTIRARPSTSPTSALARESPALLDISTGARARLDSRLAPLVYLFAYLFLSSSPVFFCVSTRTSTTIVIRYQTIRKT